MKKKLEKFIKKIKQNVKLEKIIELNKKTIEENKFVFLYVIGAVLNGILVRIVTIKEFSFPPILADLFVSLVFAAIYTIIRKKRKYAYLMTLAIISTVISVANIVYYSYYNSFISVTFVSFALTNTETGGADVLGGLLEFRYFIPFWYPIFLAISYKHLNKKDEVRKSIDKRSFKVILNWALAIFLIFLLTLKSYDYSRFHKQWNREYLVSKFGVYLYQLNDLVKSIEPSMASLFGSDKAYKEITNYYDENKHERQNNNYTDILKGKNVIAIHAESIQSLPMSLSFNGQEVTPNLNRLSKEGIYFSNFYSQVSIGTSSDTEFTLATSLLPVSSGTVFINYADKEYVTMYQYLKEMNYKVVCMHANTGDFWNRNVMYKKLGYEKFYEKSSYVIDDQIGFGLSDKSFFMQSVEYLKEISSENEHFYATMIMLSNHTPFEDLDKYGEFDLSMNVDGVTYPYLENTKLGNYLKSVHYADEQIGLLINLLREANLLDNTVIVLYGDHDARIAKSEWNKLYNYDYTTDGIKDKSDESYIELDSYWYDINRRVPFIIWSSDESFKQNYAKEVTSVTGMIDVLPTLGNMLGFYDKYALGKDMINGDDNIVVFPNGNFVTNYVYYNDNKGEYKLLQDVPLDEDYITKYKAYSEKILKVSNDIIVYNYFKKELSTEKYEGEG